MNKHGITLTMLAVTVVVMSILVVASISISTNIVRKANEQNLVTDMVLIQSQVKIIMERVAFNGDTSSYVGEQLKNAPNKEEIANGILTSEELEKDTIYIYTMETLYSLGLSKINSGDLFLVDYSNSEVFFPKGCKRADGTMLYRLSQISGISADDNL